MRVMAMVVPGARRAGNGSIVLARLAQTDKDGRYRLEDVPPGRYFIAAGPIDSPTFYPGTLLQNEARVISITQDGPSLSEIDFSLSLTAALTSNGVNPTPQFSQQNPCCNLSGLLLTEDGSRLPEVPLKVVETGHNSSVAVEDGFFRLFLQRGTAAQLAVEGLPPGYSVKSIIYGGGTNAGPVLLIDGREPQSLLFMIGIQPGTTLPRVTARGKVVNLARELTVTNLSVVLTATISNGASIVAPLQPDYSFELTNIPVGSYRAGIQAGGNIWESPTVAVIRSAVSDLRIDFGDNPFPDVQGSILARSIFADGKEITITGVATQRLAKSYFRMSVKDELTGVVTPWAIYVVDPRLVPNIAIGQTYTVTGTTASDGTNRLKAQPF